MYLDTFLSFNAHCLQAAIIVSKRNNVLKTFASTNWGQQKETVLLTFKYLKRSISNYTAAVCSRSASSTNIDNIPYAHNEALRIITCSHKMSSVYHLNSETKMLYGEDQVNILCNILYHVWIQRVYAPDHHDGSPTEADEIYTFHYTSSNCVTVTNSHEERYPPQLICQYRNGPHNGYESIKQSTSTNQ